jgi:hypothetical protein
MSCAGDDSQSKLKRKKRACSQNNNLIDRFHTFNVKVRNGVFCFVPDPAQINPDLAPDANQKLKQRKKNSQAVSMQSTTNFTPVALWFKQVF